MNAERWQLVKSILAEALEHESPEEQTASIDRSCANDAELLREVQSLMAEAKSSDALEECAETLTSLRPPDDAADIGRRVGAYVITREIGHGGMGTVYLAARADGYFEKEVAIKVLNRGAATEELVRRFRAEREVLARLDHPNIARLIDAGTMEDGRPYFIMEYVEGVPITRYVEETGLAIKDRLILSLKVMAAVEMAHRNSVIHRDLKPSNIVVNREGEPKLLDFGIAKVIARETSRLEATSLKEQRLTPISASPEQVKGQPVTVLTDIYALGVVLYELLTGTKPHQFETSHPTNDELVQVICNQSPVRPSLAVADRQRERELRGDLDAIVLRALEKDAKKRYASVAGFAGDIESHLLRKPIQARRGEPGYRIRASIFQDRSIRTAGGLAALGLISLWIAIFVRSQLKNTTSSPSPGKIGIAVLPFESFGADKENNYFADGVQEAILTNLANVSALKVISRGSVSQYRQDQKDEQVIGKALGVPYLLEGGVQKTQDHVRVDAHLVDTRTAATIWAQQYDRKLDDLFGVESELAQAIVSQLRAKLTPDEKAAIESRPTEDMLAYDLYLRARESFFQNNLTNAIHLLDQAVSRDPRFALAHALAAQVHLYYYRFEGDRSASRLDRANDAVERALRIAPKLPQSHLAKAQYYYYGLKDYEQALKELAIARSAGGEQAEFVDLSALIERRLGRWKTAIRDAEHATELDPQNPFVINELIESYISVRRYADAEATAAKAINAAVTRSGYLWTLRTEALLGSGRLDEARALTEHAPDDMSRMMELVWIALYSRDYGRASELLSEMQSASGVPWPFEGFNADLFAATIARAKGDGAEARTHFERARAQFAAELNERPNDPSLISNLALADAGLGQKNRAIEEVKRAVELCPMSRDAVDAPGYQAMLAMVYAWNGDLDSAINELEKVVRLPRSPSSGELRFSPFWDDLRHDSRFDSVIAQAAQPPVYN
jgi:serine/threonine protein kinase/Tfp pilus assembly protein PilF